MSFKYPKNVIVVVSVLAALMAGTVLLGGYANSKPADTEAPAKACQATASKGCCPSMANSAAFAQVSGEVPTATDCPKPCCGEDCPKPCCAEKPAEGCCGTSGMAGCPKTAAKNAAEQIKINAVKPAEIDTG